MSVKKIDKHNLIPYKKLFKLKKQLSINKRTNITPFQKNVPAAENSSYTILQQTLSLEKTNPTSFEYFWQGKNELAGSQFAMTEILPGFELWHYHGKIDHDVLSFQDTPPMIVFSFCFSGRFVYDYMSHGHCFEVSSQSQKVSFYPFPDFTARTTKNMEFNRLSVLLSPERFMKYFEMDMDVLGSALQQIQEKGYTAPFLRTAPLNPLVKTLLEQLHQCPFMGITHKHFFEGCALHLIMLQLKGLEPSCTQKAALVRIEPGEQKRLQAIKDMLENQLDSPPSLSELAKKAAMSPPKLNKCFRHLYGTTVFEYLRQQRFDRAKAMLEQGLTVTEASFSVGYESLASFSLAFKKRFGYAPSRYFSNQ